MIDNKQPGQLLTLTDEHLEAIAAMTGHFISDCSHFSRALTEVATQPVQLTIGNISDLPELQRLVQEKLENGTLHVQGTPDAQPADMECWYWEHQLTSGKVIDSGFSRTKVDPTDNALWGAHPEGKVSTVVQKLTSAYEIRALCVAPQQSKPPESTK